MSNFLKQNKFFLISIGAILGSLFRWQIDNIFIVNVIGCFFLGIINGLTISNRYKLIFGVGFCGSLTTFSGWSFRLYELINKGLYGSFFVNLSLIVLIGLFAIYLGNLFSRKFIN